MVPLTTKQGLCRKEEEEEETVPHVSVLEYHKLQRERAECTNLLLFTVISVKYCPNTKEGNFSFRAGFTYSFLPVNFEVNGVQIDRDCHCYNSSAEMLIVDLDRTIGGDNYTFLLSWSYPQCNNRYKGRFEDGEWRVAEETMCWTCMPTL